MSTADDLRAHAQRWRDWPQVDETTYDVAQAFGNFRECLEDLGKELPWFLLLVAEALDGGRENT